MNGARMRGIAIATLLVAGVASYIAGCGEAVGRVSTLPYYGDAEMTPRWIAAGSGEHRAIPPVAPFSLIDQHGERFTERSLDGKITVVDFFFAGCPTLCPKLARSMKRIQDSVSLDDGVLLLSYSVTPELDSAADLARYARRVGAIDGRWFFLTGDRSTIYGLARSSYFAKVDTGEDSFLHTETFYLMDRSRRIRGIYNGTLQTDISRLIEDLRTLRRE